MLRGIVLGAIRFYQRFISPGLPPTCVYYPTCSHYGYEAIQVHGVLWGSVLTVWRILRCNPFSKGGYDPVPPPRVQTPVRVSDIVNNDDGSTTGSFQE